MAESEQDERGLLERELLQLLHQIEDWLETPMIVLAFIWLVLMIAEFGWGLSGFLATLVDAIWIAFIVDFLLRLGLAPRRVAYLKQNWLTAVSLFLPALRIFRVTRAFRLLRFARATRGLRLVRVVSSLNRGMFALRATMSRRGVGYVLALTLVVLFAGAAGMYAFESGLPGGNGFANYADALWWTAMLLTTLGSAYWPVTGEGRILCLLLSIYSLGILGYITASLASFFVGRDTVRENAS